MYTKHYAKCFTYVNNNASLFLIHSLITLVSNVTVVCVFACVVIWVFR